MASSKPRQTRKSVQDDIHAMMDPEEICADLEKLYVSRTTTYNNKENQSANTTAQGDNNQQTQVFFCGIDQGTTSSIFHQIYKAGASSISRPPRKIGQAEPDNVDTTPLSLPLRLCGVDGSTTSTDIITGIFAAGVEAVVESQDRFWKPNERGSDLAMSLQRKQAEEERELRVIQIAEDLKKEAPDLIKRENLIPMIKQNQQRNREKRLQHRKDCATEPASNDNASVTNKKSVVTFKVDDVSDSDGYPSDIDEFLEFARIVVEDQNASFETTSYIEFEKALQETINSHFLDDDDDDDSMTSMSSYSGVDTEAQNNQQNILEKKPTSGIMDTITRTWTMISKGQSTDSAKMDAPMGTPANVSTDSTSASIKIDNEDVTQVTATATANRFAQELKDKSCKLKAPKPKDDVDDDSILNMTEMMSTSTASQVNSKPLPGSVASNYSMISRSAPLSSGIDNSSVASDTTYTTGSSMAAIRRQMESENGVIDKFQYDPLDNSLLSETSFKADIKIQKQPFRKEEPPPSKTITPPSDQAENESRHGILTEGMKRTVENLAYLLSEGNNNPTRKRKGVDRDVVLQKLHDVAPHLYKAVLARMESDYSRHDEHQQATSSSKASHLDKGGLPVTHKGTIGVETPTRRDQVACKNYRNESPTSHCDASKQLASKKALNSRSNMSTFFGDSKPPLSPLKASSPVTKVSLDEALEAASIEVFEVFDISRGSFWSDVLDVNEGSISDAGEDFDPSGEFPSISLDDNELTIPFPGREQQSITPSKPGDDDSLDTMIEEFLGTKIDRLNSLMQERQVILAQMERVFAELQRTPASLLRKSGFADRDRLVRSLSNGDVTFPRVQRGRALIRKIQRKRQALILARQQEEENIPQVSVEAQSIPQALDSQIENNPVQNDELISIRRRAIGDEFQFDDFLVSSLEHKPSASPPSDTSRNAIRHVREKRKMMRKKLGRSTIPVNKKALHKSMDSALETEDTVCTGSSGTKIISPPAKQPNVITIRKKQKHKECNYQPLPDQNLSFDSTQEMKGHDILQALAPPSPESPIRDYRLDTKSVELASDIACLFEVASGDLSGEEGRVLVFSDTEASDNSETLQPLSHTDDYDPMVSQSSTTIEPSWDDEDFFVKIHKKDSPTSIADFFYERDMEQKIKVEEAYERVRNASYLDEDDQLVHTAMDLFMLRDEDEDEDYHRLDNVEFLSSTRFMI